MRFLIPTRAMVLSGLLALAALVATFSLDGGVRSAYALTNCTVADLTFDSEEREFLRLINEYRVANGRVALTASVNLNRAASWMSVDMASKGYFSHTDSLGRSSSTRMSQCDATVPGSGENIAGGTSAAPALDVFNAWKASSGHNENMLRSTYRQIGIGRYYLSTSPYKWYWTTNFSTTTDGTNASNDGPPPSPTPDFSVSCNPSTLSVAPGQTGNSTCTVTSVNGFSAPVALGCTSLLANVTCGFAPSSVTPAANATANSTLTVTVGGGVAATSDAFQVTATSGTTKQTSLTLNVTAAPPSGEPVLYLSLGSSATLNGGSLAVANEDIVAWHSGGGFSLYFDGSDVGLGSFTIDAFDRIASNQLLLSFTAAGTIGGLSVDDSDVVLFTATSLGATTAGSFSLYFDGSDVGLSGDEEDVDAIQLREGKLLISTTGAFSVTGASGQDADVIEFTPAAGGIGDDSSAGTWAMYFDGSDVGLSSGTEDVDALAIDSSGNLYLSTSDAFSVTGVAGADEDVFVFDPTTTGATTTGVFSSTLFFDGSVHGLSANDIFAIDLP